MRPTLLEAEGWVRSNADAWAAGGPVVDLGVEEMASGKLAGCVGIQRELDYLDVGQVNLSYALYLAFRGRGIATRAVGLAIDVALSQGPVVEFLVGVAPDNLASVRVAERAGFRLDHLDTSSSDVVAWYVRSAHP